MDKLKLEQIDSDGNVIETSEAKLTEVPDATTAQTQENAATVATDPPAAQTSGKGSEFTTLAKTYAKLYPKNKEFHITTDKQVFLSTDKSLAQLHQNSLGIGKVQTITIK